MARLIPGDTAPSPFNREQVEQQIGEERPERDRQGKAVKEPVRNRLGELVLVSVALALLLALVAPLVVTLTLGVLMPLGDLMAPFLLLLVVGAVGYVLL